MIRASTSGNGGGRGSVGARGFTLVELVVVMGVIAILIALLMPSLSTARQAAQRTMCVARLQQQMLAAHVHAVDHGGYYPLAGVLPGTQMPNAISAGVPGIEPQNLEDPNGSKYDYFSYPYADFQRMLAPITMSLATEMSYKNVLNVQSNDDATAAERDDKGFIKNFLCPSQAGSVSELTQLPMLYYFFPDSGDQFTVWYTQAMSYVYNEAVLGWGDEEPATYIDRFNRGHGRASAVRQPAKTMFVADGLGGGIYNWQRFPYITGQPMATVYNIIPDPPVTLADALTDDGKAGDPENFDLRRHHGKINIGFCDGHVETRNITAGDLSGVFLLAP
jgi:prepilin-type N-terminal cleavage/methylation domain-containing protein/prepilin-type processing-associated H-X9-DG protein